MGVFSFKVRSSYAEREKLLPGLRSGFILYVILPMDEF